MTKPLLSIQHLKVSFKTNQHLLAALSDISFDILPGEFFSLLGESGCGKSLTALSILQLLPVNAYYHNESRILFHDHDLLNYSQEQMRKIRGSKISIIFQEPMTSLNPVLTVGKQIAEVLIQHKHLSGKLLAKKTSELLSQVGIDDPQRLVAAYPHQLSGGQKQRVMIAMAIATEPDLLIADEPTTALDVTIQAQILELLRALQQKLGMSVLLITHDLGVVKQVADRVAVMYAGEVVELVDKAQFFSQPLHPYSRKLFAALPSIKKRDLQLYSPPETVPSLQASWDSCRFDARCLSYQPSCDVSLPKLREITPNHWVRCHRVEELEQAPIVMETMPQQNLAKKLNKQAILTVTNLQVNFTSNGSIFRPKKIIRAVDGISFELLAGETLAVVGESGSGKTTTGRALLQLIPLTNGQITFQGQNISQYSAQQLKQLRKSVQIIFQDPFSAMNPRMLVGDIIMEGMIAHNLYPNAKDREQKVLELLSLVGLNHESFLHYPHQFSGGQRQRICIARALAVEPQVIICDEPTSALDVSVQAQILNLLKELQSKLGVTYLFISHNISVVSYLADRIIVMYQGKIVESGDTLSILNNPQHAYTKRLLAAVPSV